MASSPVAPVEPAADGDALALVAIGLSAGGLDACEALLRGLPQVLPAAIVVVKHFAGAALPYVLHQWLGRCVLPAAPGVPVRAGRVYAPLPRQHVVVNPDGSFGSSTRGRIGFVEPSVDWLFESAAATYGSHTVAVVLSGANGDGARGAACVRRAGGSVIVQDPRTCSHPRMPEAALRLRCVDQMSAPDALAGAVLNALGRLDMNAFRERWERPFALLA